MSRRALLLNTLAYHWRTNLAVWLGVVVGTAVIGGALIVGDSVRGSLRDMTLARLGQVDLALTGPRFVSEQLSLDIRCSFDHEFPTIAPAIILETSVERRMAGSVPRSAARAGRVNLIASVKPHGT